MFVTFIEKLFNISPPEFSRTGYAWFLRFIFRLGVVVGATMLVSYYAARYSIETLPFVFMLQAFIAIGGMLVSSLIIHRFELRKIISFHLILGSFILCIASLFSDSTFLFLSLLLFIGGVTVPQVQILLSNYTEDFFSPAEAVRIFPIIESADVVAGIFAGILLSQVFPLDFGFRFVFLWASLMTLVVLVMYLLKPKNNVFLHYLYEITHQKTSRKPKKLLKDGLFQIRQIPFLKVFFAAMFFYWILFQFIEFQFTKVVHDSLAHGDVEGEMSKMLGSLHLFFYSLALVMQLMVAGRIMRFLGTAGGFLFHSIVTLMGALSLVFGFGHFAMMLVKNNYEFTGVVYKNSYENAYYAFKHGTQRFYRELLESFVSPVATIVATVLLSIFNNFFISDHRVLAINILLLSASAFFVFICSKLKEPYTSMVKQHVFHPTKHSPDSHALQILSENGHAHKIQDLIIYYDKCNDKFKSRVLDILVSVESKKVVDFLLEKLLHDQRSDFKILLDGLTRSPLLSLANNKYPYLRQKVVHSLKNLYEKSTHDCDKISILQALSLIDLNSAVFFSDLLKTELSVPVLCEILMLIGKSHDDDKSFFLVKYLHNENAYIRAEAARSLFYSKTKQKVLNILDVFQNAQTVDEKLAYILKLSDLQPENSYRVLMSWILDTNVTVRMAALMTLMKLHHYHIAQILAHELLHSTDKELHLFVKEHTFLLTSHAKKVLSDALIQQTIPSLALKRRISFEDIIEKVDFEELKKLHRAYTIIGCHEEISYIEDIMHNVKTAVDKKVSYIFAQNPV